MVTSRSKGKVTLPQAHRCPSRVDGAAWHPALQNVQAAGPCTLGAGEEVKSHRAWVPHRCSVLRWHLPPTHAAIRATLGRADLAMPRCPQECRTQNLYHSLRTEEEQIWARQRGAVSLWVLRGPGQGWRQCCWGVQAPPGLPLPN